MTRYRSVPLLITLCSACAAPQLKKDLPTDREVSYRESVQLHLTKQDGHYQLASTTRKSITYCSTRSTEDATLGIYSPHYAPVKDLQASYNGEPLDEDRIVEVTAEGGYFLDDAKVYLLKFRKAGLGDTVSWRYQQRYRSPGWLPLFIVPNRDRVERYELVVEHPASAKVDFAIFFPRKELKPTLVRSATQTKLVFADLPQQPELEAFAFNDVQAYVWPQVREGGQPLTPLTAEQYSSFYKSLFKPFAPFDQAQGALIDKLLVGATSKREQVKRLYDWVRKNVRYIADERGIHGIVPRDPSLVMQRRYGDCKDVAYLVVEMARRAGVQVDPVVLHTDWPLKLPGFHKWMTNHAIAAFRDGDQLIFMDPTCDLCEFGNLPEQDLQKPALLLGDQPQQLVIPRPPQEATTELTLRATTDKLGDAQARIVLRNEALRYLQTIQRNPMSTANRATAISHWIGKRYYKLQLRALKVEAVAEDQAVLVGQADLSHFVVRSGQRLYLPKVPFRLLSARLLERRKDNFDIHLQRRLNDALTIVIEGAGLSSSNAAPLRLGDKATAELNAELEVEAGSVQARYRIVQHNKLFPAGSPERTGLLDFQERALQGRREMFALQEENIAKEENK